MSPFWLALCIAAAARWGKARATHYPAPTRAGRKV